MLNGISTLEKLLRFEGRPMMKFLQLSVQSRGYLIMKDRLHLLVELIGEGLIQCSNS